MPLSLKNRAETIVRVLLVTQSLGSVSWDGALGETNSYYKLS